MSNGKGGLGLGGKGSSSLGLSGKGGLGFGAKGGVTGSKPSSGGGSFFGGILHDIGAGAHWVGEKASLAGHDIEGIPGGLLQMGTTEFGALKDTVEHPWNSNQSFSDWLHGRNESPAQQRANQLAGSIVKGAVESVKHPLRDPFQTVTTVAPLLDGPLRAAEAIRGVDITAPRVLRVGERDMSLSPRSKGASGRLLQTGYDKALQRALDTNPEGRLAGHAMKRVGGQIAEAERPRQYMRSARADALTKSGRKLSKSEQAALRLTSENVTPTEARMFHEAQAAKGVNAAQHLGWAKTYRQIEDQGWLKVDKNGNVIVDAAKHPRLAAVDQKLAAVQREGEQIIHDQNLMTPEGAKERLNAPGAQIRAAVPESAREHLFNPQGRGFVTEKQLEVKAPRTGAGRASSNVIGEVRTPISAKSRTGLARELGHIPDNTTRLAAQNLRGLQRYVNTHELRKRWLDTSSPVRRSSHDILIRVPGSPKEDIPPAIQEILGKGRSTLDELVGAHEGARAHLEDIIPGLKDKFASDKKHMIGEPAPKGYKWVDRRIVGDYAKAFSGSRGKIGKAFDNLNSSITAATVYYKIGHVGTRFLTNAVTNIIQGSASPRALAHSYQLFRRLSEADRRRAWAATGQTGFEAMPHEGTDGNIVTRNVTKAATKGAQFWAHRADALFRFNSIAYEAARAGIKTPEAFRHLLDQIEHPENLSDTERARVENIAKQANREAIAYDRLGDTEKRFIARAFWFYPWVKSSITYSGRTLIEHPFKAGILGNAGAQGRQSQEQAFGGRVPSYEFGLVPLGGPNAQGYVPTTNLSTFSPFSTLGSLLQVPEYTAASENLNPAAAALLGLLTRTNQYGQHSNAPVTDFLKALASATPEFQIGSTASGKKSKMFPDTSTWSQLERMLFGPAFPRNVDPAELAKAYGLEQSGR